MPDHFPTTHATTIIEATRNPNADALAAVAARIIERYAQPLEAYAQGSTLREIGEPRELVHAFLVSKFGSPASCRAYLESWNASGLTLRRWMMNGLLLHVRGVVRDARRSRERPLESALGALASAEPDPSAAFERAWAKAIPSSTMPRTASSRRTTRSLGSTAEKGASGGSFSATSSWSS
jgi:hypothetical protein